MTDDTSNQELRFDGRSVIITGGGRGIGRSHALLLASRGARVVVADLGGSLEGGGSSAGPADEVVEEIKAAGGEAVACYASVADPAGAESIVQTALDSFGRLDVVINNAGISAPDLFEDLPIEHFDTLDKVNYLGTVYVCKAAWPHLVAARYGRIVNTCSEGMLGIHQKITGYGGSKGGVFGLTRTLASEGVKYGIAVNGVAPRARTRMSDSETMSKVFGIPADLIEKYMPNLPPDMVSPAAAFLAHESCTLNGEVLAAGGGQVQRLVVLETKGIHDPNISPEFIAQNLGALLDTRDAQLVPVQSEIALQQHQ